MGIEVTLICCECHVFLPLGFRNPDLLQYADSREAQQESVDARMRWSAIGPWRGSHGFPRVGMTTTDVEELCGYGCTFGEAMLWQLASHAAVSQYLNDPDFFGGSQNAEARCLARRFAAVHAYHHRFRLVPWPRGLYDPDLSPPHPWPVLVFLPSTTDYKLWRPNFDEFPSLGCPDWWRWVRLSEPSDSSAVFSSTISLSFSSPKPTLFMLPRNICATTGSRRYVSDLPDAVALWCLAYNQQPQFSITSSSSHGPDDSLITVALQHPRHFHEQIDAFKRTLDLRDVSDEDALELAFEACDAHGIYQEACRLAPPHRFLTGSAVLPLQWLCIIAHVEYLCHTEEALEAAENAFEQIPNLKDLLPTALSDRCGRWLWRQITTPILPPAQLPSAKMCFQQNEDLFFEQYEFRLRVLALIAPLLASSLDSFCFNSRLHSCLFDWIDWFDESAFLTQLARGRKLIRLEICGSFWTCEYPPHPLFATPHANPSLARALDTLASTLASLTLIALPQLDGTVVFECSTTMMMTALRSLTISACSRVTLASLVSFLQRCPNLEELNLGDMSFAPDNLLQASELSLPRLRHLGFPRVRLLSQQILFPSQLVNHWGRQLQSLDLAFCSELTDEDVKQLHLICGQSLERIRITFAAVLTDAAVHHLALFDRLVDIDLSGCPRIHQLSPLSSKAERLVLRGMALVPPVFDTDHPILLRHLDLSFAYPLPSSLTIADLVPSHLLAPHLSTLVLSHSPTEEWASTLHPNIRVVVVGQHSDFSSAVEFHHQGS